MNAKDAIMELLVNVSLSCYTKVVPTTIVAS